MLNRIFIQNFALIDSLEIHLEKGLQVITGETGAGKSIMLGALRLILGERADIKSIQNTEKKSIIEAEFQLTENFRSYFDENDLDFENQTIIRREILPSGKSRAFINDVPATLDTLKELSSQLIDIHSQFETSQLFSEAFQFEIIDGLAENQELFNHYRFEFQEFKKLNSILEKLKNQLSEGNKEASYKQFLLAELEQEHLDDFDWEVLQEKLNLQENAENISEHLQHIIERVDQDEVGVLDHLNEIRNRLSKIGNLSHHLSAYSERFETLFFEIKDFIFELQNEAEKIEINPEELHSLQSKIDKINSLFSKHNVNSVEELIEIRNSLSNEQDQFYDLENEIEKTTQTIKQQAEKVEKLAQNLSENRKKAIPVFIEKMEILLKQLGLEKAKIEVPLTQTESFSLFGKETIQILFQANSGFPLKPIQTAISGGERSRVMLGVKKIMAENTKLPTLILDEIDTGVSGKVAGEIGKVMQEMAKNMQLIVITHLAQVAAKGDNNYKVQKKEVNGKTQSTIIPLNEKEKLQEIAQLLSGDTVTDAALKQAEELMK